MKKITILYDYTAYTYRWLSYLLVCKKQFRENGYVLCFPKIFNGLIKGIIAKFDIQKEKNKKIKFSDIIMIAVHPSNYLYENKKEFILWLTNLRQYCNKLIWLDTSDSSGTTFFEVLPYVDKYLKKQLYKDKQMYNLKMKNDRLYCEFYKNFSNDDNESHNININNDDYNKIGLSWNIGLSNLFEDNRLRFLLNYKRKHNNFCFIEPSLLRTYDLYFNGTLWNNSVGYQRNLVIDKIEKSTLNHSEVRIKVSKKEYIKNIKNSKALVSPFGWGEICKRDFESIIYGTLLIKPSMDHLETFPNYFIPYETYIPLDWNIDNLDSVRNVFCNQKKYFSIINNLKEIFLYYYTIEGKRDFVKHILTNISE